MTVAPNGRVLSAKIDRSSGSKELDEYSIAWVKKQWRFPPGDSTRSFHGFCQYGQEAGSVPVKEEPSAKR
jgi:TonB family protein